MNKYEEAYFTLVKKVLEEGYVTQNRNGLTKSLIGETLRFSLYENDFPILGARKYPMRGVVGEFAAILRGPKCLQDFLDFGCTYWAKWANKDHTINIDYGNAWLDFNGVNQLEWLINEIKTNPTSRRLIVSGWNPANVIGNKLNLPCCHYSYQFFVRDDTLNMCWIQRSADLMIGVPADAVLTSLWLIALANEVGLEPGEIVMQFGDTHIYEEHEEKAVDLYRTWFNHRYSNFSPKYKLLSDPAKPLIEFIPKDIEIVNYDPYGEAVQFLLKE